MAAVRKYEFTGETKVCFGIRFHRIKALISFGRVSAGDLGGWIEKEENLNQEGNAWVSGNARVFGNAEVSGDAWVFGNAEVSGDAEVSGNARVFGDAWVSGDAEVSGNAWVFGNAEVYGNAQVSGNARVCGNAWVSGNADFIWISKIGSRDATITFVKSKDLKIIVVTGCFYGTIDIFNNEVRKKHGENEHAQAYFLAMQLAKLRIDLTDKENKDVRF